MLPEQAPISARKPGCPALRRTIDAGRMWERNAGLTPQNALNNATVLEAERRDALD